jgi:hypothetical protein
MPERRLKVGIDVDSSPLVQGLRRVKADFLDDALYELRPDANCGDEVDCEELAEHAAGVFADLSEGLREAIANEIREEEYELEDFCG